ncbi:MAG: hypothetical protein OXH16_01655 [Gemmatimonadetes bacterium]|nr:hypothetical protein [Gemmatimonadota bacterium]
MKKESPNSEDIINALKRSGYLMEQEVATQLEALNFQVRTNMAFEDIEEKKSREIDVRAIKRVAHNEEKKLSAFVEIIAECKNSMNPFVFIGRPKNQTDNQHPPQELVFPIAKYKEQKDFSKNGFQIRTKDAFFHLGFDKVHPDYTSEMKAVQFCRIDRKGSSWHANHGGLYNSIFYPMAKALTAQKREIFRNNQSSEWRYFWLFVPIVIISGNILYVDSIATDPVLQKRNDITFKREIKSGKLDGIYTITFVCQKQLEQFISDRLEPLVTRMVDLTTIHADFVLKQNITWKE